MSAVFFHPSGLLFVSFFGFYDLTVCEDIHKSIQFQIIMTIGSGKFISKKVSKVRWMPQYDTSQLDSSTLITGSWDDEVNSVVPWTGAGPGGEANLQSQCEVNGDVTGLEWLAQDTLVVSTSAGIACHSRSAQPASQLN